MREDFEKFNLEQDLNALKADIDQLSVDVVYLMRKSTIGRMENKIIERPFVSLLSAFGIGLTCSALLQLFRKKR